MVKFRLVRVKAYKRPKGSVRAYRRKQLVHRGKFGKIIKVRSSGVKFIRSRGKLKGSRRLRKGEKGSVWVLRESRAGRLLGRA